MTDNNQGASAAPGKAKKSSVSKSIPNIVLTVGELYHVYGWNYKAQFRLVAVGEHMASIVTPKGGQQYFVDKSKLFYARKTKRKLKPQEQVNDLPTTDPDTNSRSSKAQS